MLGPKKIIILILSIQLIHVHSDEQPNKNVTKLITYVKVLLNGLTDHIKFVDDKLVHLNQLPQTEVDHLIKNHELHHEELIELENKLHLLQTNLTELTSLPLNNEQEISIAKRKMIALKNAFIQVKTTKFRNCRNFPLLFDFKKIDEVLGKYDKFIADMEQIYWKIDDKEETQFVEDCVRAIEIRSFERAAEKFSYVRDDNKMFDIVNRVYSEDGAYYLLEFGKNIPNLKRIYLLYNALFNKLHNDKERSKNVIIHYFKYLLLLKSIKRELFDQPYDSDLKAKAAELLKSIKGDKVKLGVKLLTNEVLNKGIRTVYFLERPLTFDYEIVGDICYQTIVDNHKQHLNDLRDTLNLVFSEITKNYEGNDLHFGQFIKYLETKLKGSEYESSLQLDLVGLKEKLPNIVKNMLYSETVCIKQHGLDTYLKQEGDTYTYLVKSYRVYSGHHRSDLEERWQLIHVHGDEYIIKHVLHDYSLDVNDTTVNTCRGKGNDHKVTTTNNKLQSNIWKIEVTNEYAYLKNTANNEYLFASPELTTGDAATSSFNGEFSKAYQWNIVNCTNVPLREGPV
uniref:Putative secreted protein n=1 Tax=Panstrongylus lignarius TaxID=156445 RepID=A0A224XMI9_9HEMI